MPTVTACLCGLFATDEFALASPFSLQVADGDVELTPAVNGLLSPVSVRPGK